MRYREFSSSEVCAVYGNLARSGREFMNYGGRAHAEWRDDQYVPITFYNEMTSDQVVADIELGHQIVMDVTNTRPVGFRAPHSGASSAIKTWT